MLDRYFTMEDPRRIEPAERELYVETTLESGLRLRGYVDRLDVASGGAVRIVDYKTGTAPARGIRGPRAVPDEVLRPRAVADPRCRATAAAAHVPRQRRDPQVPAGRGGPARDRAQGTGAVAGHRASPGVG